MSVQEKVAAITTYVQQNVRYQAIEFGPRAMIMNPADQVLANGYGDCKDHSILLYNMLRAVGIPAELSLVNTGGDGGYSRSRAGVRRGVA